MKKRQTSKTYPAGMERFSKSELKSLREDIAGWAAELAAEQPQRKAGGPTVPVSAAEVRAVRSAVHLTQAGLGEVLGVSGAAVRHWENGLRKPEPGYTKLLRVLRRNPELVAVLRAA
jgi:putative transcriptional regulator